MKTIIINTLFILISTFAFAQQNNPSLIIDLTEKQAFERYKKSNVRKALGLKIKDFNYKDLIQNAQSERLSEVIVLKDYNSQILQSIKNTYQLGDISLNQLNTAGVGYPCEDCHNIIYLSLSELKEHPFF